MSLKFLISVLLLFFVLSSCTEQNDKQLPSHLDQSSDLKYAKRFAIKKHKNGTLLYVFGNRMNTDTTATYLVSDSVKGKVAFSSGITYMILAPCKRVAALSSIYANMLCELNALDRLVAIDNIDYYSNPLILQKYKQGLLLELLKGPELDLEQTVLLKPDIIFAFGMGGVEDRSLKLDQSGIPIVLSIDHLEETALARAEWIKFFAVFVGKEKQADSIFNSVENNYTELKQMVLHSNRRPSVFSELKYGETWYEPGGKSFMAQLFKDAGANYIWRDDQHSGSLPLSFEQVYSKAKDADYWVNLSLITNKEELLRQESRYDQFSAFKNGRLFNNNKTTNPMGYSVYWETGMIYPNRILSDLIQIFHPELKNQIKNDLYYYRQIK